MALITNPSIEDIHSLISSIQTQIDELPTATETPQWVPLVESFFAACSVAESALIDLKAAILAEALANGIEEMTDDQALYLDAAESELFDSIFSGWSIAVHTILVQVQERKVTFSEAESTLKATLADYRTELSQPHKGTQQRLDQRLGHSAHAEPSARKRPAPTALSSTLMIHVESLH